MVHHKTYLWVNFQLEVEKNTSGCYNYWTDLPTVLGIPSAHCDGPRAPLLSLGALGLGTEADLDRHVRLFGHGHQNLATVPCRCATRVVFLMLQEYLQKAQQPWIY